MTREEHMAVVLGLWLAFVAVFVAAMAADNFAALLLAQCGLFVLTLALPSGREPDKDAR